MKRELSGPWIWISRLFGLAIIFFSVNQIFLLKPFGFLLLENSYFYILIGIALAQVFILFAPKNGTLKHVAWYDLILATLSLSICLFFSYHGLDITSQGWMFAPPQ
jgi:TRAP-type uncharacterized transport system fused permease subunit